MRYLLCCLFVFFFSEISAQITVPSFPPINFISDKSDIPKDSLPLLNVIADTLRNDTSYLLEISGHTDNVGNEPFNMKLSEQRAGKIADYLIQKGIDKNRIRCKGCGSTKPVMNNDFEIGRERNRRAEFIITKGNYKIITIGGKIIDQETQKPIQAEITIEDRKTGEEIAKAKSDSRTGVFEISAWLKETEQYELTFNADDYFFDVITFSPKTIDKMMAEKKTFSLPQIKIGNRYKFKNMNFYGNEARMLPQSLPALKSLLKMMQKNEKLKILIEGHTNGAGEPSQDLKWHQSLSDARTKTVFDYLVYKGIDSARIQRKGFGCSRMLFPNAREENLMQENRRVEIKILEK